ncbi:MAG: hypothetical protein U1E56_01320 [Bauldia sp.]
MSEHAPLPERRRLVPSPHGPSAGYLRMAGWFMAAIAALMLVTGGTLVATAAAKGKSAAMVWSGWGLGVIAPVAGAVYCFLRASRVAGRERRRADD